MPADHLLLLIKYFAAVFHFFAEYIVIWNFKWNFLLTTKLYINAYLRLLMHV